LIESGRHKLLGFGMDTSKERGEGRRGLSWPKKAKFYQKGLERIPEVFYHGKSYPLELTWKKNHVILEGRKETCV